MGPTPPMPAALRVALRLLNEAPAIAASVLVVVGVAESEASAIVEAVGAVATAVLMFVARSNWDGPATQLLKREV